MPGPYFRTKSWSAFTYQGTVYELTYLDEYEFSVADTEGVTRNIAVTFSDHCFTREPLSGDDPALVYAESDRRPGHFCFERYHLSFGLVEKIKGTVNGKVWRMQGDNFATLPVVDQSGHSILYGIIFGLDRVKGLPVDLHMRIKTAHPIDENAPVPETQGETRFRHLVTLRMKGKMPPRIVGGGKKPTRT